jgi:hypothetical protein
MTLAKQICNHIPPHLVPMQGRKYKVDTRSLSEWSHVVALICGQKTHTAGLTDNCDGPDLNRSRLKANG